VANRNDLCPCGSGAKFKKCCLPKHEAEETAWRQSQVSSETCFHAVQNFVKRTLPKERFGEAWSDFWGGPKDDVKEHDLQLAIPWLFFTWRGHDHRTFAELYLDATPAVDITVRDYARAAVMAPFSFFEITRVEKGRGVAVVDLLQGGDEVFVLERTGSQTMLPRMVLFGKLVPWAGVLMFDGLGPRAIEPQHRDDLLRAARRALGSARKRRFTPEELHAHIRELLAVYRMAEEATTIAAAMKPTPTRVNTDGERLFICTTRYRFDAADRADVEEAIRAIDHLDRDDDDEARVTFRWWRPGNSMHKSWDNTTLGNVTITETEMTLETNSRERDQRLRALIDGALPGRLTLIDTLAKDANDRRSQPPKLVGAAKPVSQIPPEVEKALIAAMMERHYAGWPDIPLPALKGRTPRDAVKSAAGRREVDALLRTMEYQSAGGPLAMMFDFGTLRRELGLT